ncbi:hypothetical protein DPMN_085566 [Dreissena polymorpha]|uniref:HTH psq-type domain-containing protein n=1 Tax=Dreissena polymorpha TaxID=45954 RepID=A0A9D3YG02_DREPO|nr:hypothetical protein DPMN_085566 [Dreissena polymorpha]
MLSAWSVSCSCCYVFGKLLRLYFTSRMSRPLMYALENAVGSVKSKSMVYFKASRLYNIPRSTIFAKVKGHSSIECTMGPHTVLTAAEEKRIV